MQKKRAIFKVLNRINVRSRLKNNNELGGCCMRVERISSDQFTIYLSFEDLIERGFTKEDLWQDASSVQNLFSDMMYEASTELDFELEGMLLVHVQLMQAQGMHIIVTQNKDEIDDSHTDLDYDQIEMKVTLDESMEFLFLFKEFEDIIRVASYLSSATIYGGQVFYFEGHYYMQLNDADLNDRSKEDIIAIMSEFSYPSIISSYRLKEYGKEIYPSNAVQQIIDTFY